MRLFTKLSIFSLLFASAAFGQVSVAPVCQLGKCQFFDSNGRPLASGRVYSYLGGTTTLSNTYKESTGTVQNTNPIVLDAGGYASVWLANHTYKFCTYNSLSVLQYPCQDNVTGYLGLLNLANTWTLPQTFGGVATFTLTDNQIVLGAPGAQTTLDFPPPAGNITLHFPNTADTMVGRATIDTLTNKTLSNPVINTMTVDGVTIQPVVVLKNTTLTTQTGDTGNHVIYTVPIAAGLMTASGQMRITLPYKVNAVTANVTIFIKYGGTSIYTTALNTSYVGQNGLFEMVLGGNLGATNSQSWDHYCVFADSAYVVAGPSTATPNCGNLHHTTSAVDSTVGQNLTVEYQGANNTDSMTFYRVIVEIL